MGYVWSLSETDGYRFVSNADFGILPGISATGSYPASQYGSGGFYNSYPALTYASRDLYSSYPASPYSSNDFYGQYPASSGLDWYYPSRKGDKYTSDPYQYTSDPYQYTSNPYQYTSDQYQYTSNPYQYTSDPNQDTSRPITSNYPPSASDFLPANLNNGGLIDAQSPIRVDPTSQTVPFTSEDRQVTQTSDFRNVKEDTSDLLEFTSTPKTSALPKGTSQLEAANLNVGSIIDAKAPVGVDPVFQTETVNSLDERINFEEQDAGQLNVPFTESLAEGTSDAPKANDQNDVVVHAFESGLEPSGSGAEIGADSDVEDVGEESFDDFEAEIARDFEVEYELDNENGAVVAEAKPAEEIGTEPSDERTGAEKSSQGIESEQSVGRPGEEQTGNVDTKSDTSLTASDGHEFVYDY